MKLFRLYLLTVLVLALVSVFHLEQTFQVTALEATKAPKGIQQKVKCKEQVDEALKQYWDKDPNDQNNDDNNNDDDDDDDDDDDKNKDVNKVDHDDDSQENDEDRSKNNSNDDDDDSKESTKSNEKDDDEEDDDNDDKNDKNDNDKSEEIKNRVKKNASDDDDDDNDDDDQHNTVPAPKKAAQTNNNPSSSTKNSKNLKNNDDDDDDDDDDDEKNDKKKSKKNPSNPTKQKNKTKTNDNNDNDDDDNDSKELSEEELAKQQHQQKRSRTHVDDILKVYEIGSQDDNIEQNLIQSIFRDVKKIYESTVKPLETIYKYRQITTRLISDAEIFSKPMVLFLGGKSTGKSSLVNYLLGIDETPWQISTGAASKTKFTILSYGENYTHLSPIELAADFTYSSLQRFGEKFLSDYIEAHRLPINILRKMTIVDSPGLIDMIPSLAMAKQTIDNDVYQWFIDRSDVIYIVIDVSQLHLSTSLRALLDQLKGREIRFVISKSDIASHSQIISMIGQLLWVLSPIMSSERPPMVYALTTLQQNNFDEFLDAQETSWLKDLSQQLSGISRIESHIAEVRRHAVRVRNHAKLIDCYLSTYYKNKGLFTFGASSRQLAADIAENPHNYRIYSGAFMGQLQNISRYDLPDPGVYREFFRSNPLIDFKPLTSTCSYFRGCPIDKLDVAIAYDLPELVGKYRKLTKINQIQN